MKAQRQADLAAEEERMRQQVLEKFAEDDRIEQMNAQKRRMKMLEHRREVCPAHLFFPQTVDCGSAMVRPLGLSKRIAACNCLWRCPCYVKK